METLLSYFYMFTAALSASAVKFCTNLVVAVLVFIIGKWLIRKIVKLATRIFNKKKLEPSLRTFLESLINVCLWLALAIVIISIMGIEASSFVALFTGAGMAIGMAMSGTLSNFAGGVMVLIFKPYKVGDYIKAQGYEGIVKEIQIFNTLLVTLDNKTIIIPNGALSTGSLENFSKQQYRRVDLNYDFAYGTDYEVVREAIEKIQQACPEIIQEPISGEPVIGPWQGLAAMGESGCTIATRSWCKCEDYWTVTGYMNHEVYQQLRKSGYMFPFNKLDVNIIQK